MVGPDLACLLPAGRTGCSIEILSFRLKAASHPHGQDCGFNLSRKNRQSLQLCWTLHDALHCFRTCPFPGRKRRRCEPKKPLACFWNALLCRPAHGSRINLLWPLAKKSWHLYLCRDSALGGLLACALPIDQHVGQLTLSLSMLRMSQPELRSVAARNKIPWSSCKTEPICDMRRIAAATAVAEQHST